MTRCCHSKVLVSSGTVEVFSHLLQWSTEGGRDCHCGHLFIGVECDETEIMGSASLPPPAWTHQTITCYMLYTMSTARDLVATRPRRSLRRWCINCTALKKKHLYIFAWTGSGKVSTSVICVGVRYCRCHYNQRVSQQYTELFSSNRMF